MNFLKNYFKNTILVSNRLDPDQADILLGLIRVQTVCKSYQQTTLGDKELNSVQLLPFFAKRLKKEEEKNEIENSS